MLDQPAGRGDHRGVSANGSVAGGADYDHGAVAQHDDGGSTADDHHGAAGPDDDPARAQAGPAARFGAHEAGAGGDDVDQLRPPPEGLAGVPL